MHDTRAEARQPDPKRFSCEDIAILDLFHPVVREWWLEAFGSNDCLFTPPQRQAVPLIWQGKNVLICSPTGSGKTLSAFISIINQLFVMAAEEKLANSVYCLYISPLKSLANDIHRNLSRPLSEIQTLAKEKGLFIQDIRHAIRHGDIPAQEKARMNRSTPHILNTTPESLAILLSSPRFREKLATVKWVIVDEIHSLAASKRGVHLTLSLERLEELKREFQQKNEPAGKGETEGKNKTAGKDELWQTNGGKGQGELETQADWKAGGFVRIGCSATVEPLREVADFLAGNFRAIETVDCRFSRSFDLRLTCPVPDLIRTDQKELSDRFYELLHRLVGDHKSALVFANSRNGAERVLNNMRERYPQSYDAVNSACHHGSMGREARLDTESRLKQGQLKMVCTSTSLELGIDMPYIDLVIQIGSPKSVASLLQRFGRGGHSLDQVVVGRIIALKEDDILECAVMLEKARRGEVERIHIAKNALDALCQHILGMSLERDWLFDELLNVVRRSYCYRSLDEEELMSAVLYLSAALPGLEDRSIYPKIRYDPSARKISGRGGGSRMIYNTNSGMIPDQFSCDLFTKDGHWVGRLDESYLERLEPKDVFSVGGQSYSFCFRRGGKIYVEPASEKPGIPTWSSERLPLSFDLGRSILSFQGDLLWMMKSQKAGACGGRGHEGNSDRNSKMDPKMDQTVNSEVDQKAAVLRWLQRQYFMDEFCSGIIYERFRKQIALLGEDSVPTCCRLVVQECLDLEAKQRIFYVLSGYGLRCNEGLARMAAYLLIRQRIKDAFIAASDIGFMLIIPESARANIGAIINSIREENCEDLLYRALQNTSILKSVFRINATRSFMILKSYKGRRKSARHQQFDADMLIGFAAKQDDFAVLKESFREIIEDRFEVENIKEVLRGLACGEIEVVVKKDAVACPLAYSLAVLGIGGAGEQRARIREMERRVQERTGKDQKQKA